MLELNRLTIQDSFIKYIDTRLNNNLQYLSFGVGQVCLICPYVELYFNGNKILSVGSKTECYHFNTGQYIFKEYVSLGEQHDADFYGEWIYFSDNKINSFALFDHNYLFMCSYINLRGASFNSVEPINLPSLVYIDISFSNIIVLDFRGCYHLAKVLKDESQLVEVNNQNIIWLLLIIIK